MVGAEVQIPESELLAPDDGEYYQFDLVGSRVVTVTGQEIGKVTDIVPAAGNDLLEVSRGDREVLIPFTKQICREVDILAKRIVIDPPEGLLDLNEV